MRVGSMRVGPMRVDFQAALDFTAKVCYTKPCISICAAICSLDPLLGARQCAALQGARQGRRQKQDEEDTLSN